MKRVFIVENEIIIAKDIERVLSSNGYETIGIATTYDLAGKEIPNLKPDIILCDINLDGPRDGIYLMAEIHTKCNIPVIFITAHCDADTLAKASKVKPAGYITKPFTANQVLSSVALALASKSEPETPSLRELDVLKLMANGKTSQQIAETLSISFNTVETHRKNLLKKYSVNTTAQLMCLATSKGWVEYGLG
jgi:DNA-binding NarL/FixJ family response regulator